MTIKIPVEAEFNAGDLKAQLDSIRQAFNDLGREAEKAGRVKFSPISSANVDDVRRMKNEFEAMLRLSGGLRKALDGAGQGGRQWHQVDWRAVFPNDKQRQGYAGNLLGRLSPNSVRPVSPEPATSSPHQTGTPGVGTIVGGIAQAGLRASGQAGGVAAGALGTGMSSGFGAGMMGLLGGIGALAVGRLVGGATENIGKAEDNAVAYDRLKRVLGDVSVSFTGLKTVLEDSARANGVSLDESAKLGTQFAKSGNLQGNQYGTLAGELSTGVGMSRSLGLDPSQGVGFLGSMRGMRQTQDEQGSRKMALLVGETIAKSGAFAKADEVMGAISGYVTSQTHASLGANASGFAGMFSSMVGSGIPGMDPAGAAGILSKINSSLSAGGAKGEASQFATAMIGKRLGLDPSQTRALREGGAFATNDNTFGKGSVAEKYGLKGPSGDTTLLKATMDFVRERYGGSPGLLAEATANHLGIGMRQAMAVLSIDPSKMGELSGQLKRSGVDLKDMNFAGLGSLAKVVSGSSSDRVDVASELWSRTGKDKLNTAESSKLDTVMKTGSEQEQKDVLAQLIASRDQEATQGKDIRDSKTAVENIKTLMSDQLLPVTQAMRDGIMYMAGGGKKSPQQIREDLAKVEINDRFDRLVGPHESKRLEAMGPEFASGLTGSAYAKKQEEARQIQADASSEIKRLEKERVNALKDALEKLNSHPPENATATPARSVPSGWGASTLSSGTGTAATLLDAVIGQESGGQHLGANGDLLRSSAGARGITQIMPSTGQDPGYGVSPLQNDSEEEHRRFGGDYLGAMLQLFGGDKQKALAAYNAGPGRVNKSVQKHGTDWLQHMPKETRNYVPNVLDRESQGTPIPAEGKAAQRTNTRDPLATSQVSGEMQLSLNLSAEARRLLQGPTSPLTTRLGPARPFGWA
ncbi:transglycosylase SLT domain-containing protein [Pseudomonas sp.]|uniref:transglycosylase SLT domain-containing protein n=1 Tax=Pseudomonas sp. TaxID=306 RepID=UPI003FD6EB40